MKIPNYDKKQNTTSKKLNNIFDEDFRLLIAGESGCGKTNTLMHILRKPLVYYDKIYIYSPNLHQEKIQDLKEMMDRFSEKVGYSVLEIGGQEEIKNTNEYPSENRKIVVFDDLLNAPEKFKIKSLIIGLMEDTIISLQFIFPNLIMTPPKIKVKLFKYDSLSTKHKKSFESYCKRKLD